MPPYKAIILDMGDVLFRWRPQLTTNIPITTLGQLINTDLWHDFERGKISPDECYRQLGETFSLAPDEIATTFKQANAGLMPATEMTDLLLDIRSMHHNAEGIKFGIYMMSNISRLDYDQLREAHASYVWDVFDGIFASGYVGMRKPDRCFYELVLERVKVSPEEVVFVDDRLENVKAAEELGMKGVHCVDIMQTSGLLRELLQL
ncbi:hypothetical protein AbraIFM66950_008205 [Aspergillus brasiliensis]|nr:hypothetical protein AbraIFM66950_008205 [Aspergillus brasiliensis]